MTRLYDIPKEIEAFELELIRNGGELTPELEQRWADFIAGSKERMEAAAFVLNALRDDSEKCEKEVDRLRARSKSIDNNRKRLGDLTLFALRAMGGKLKTALVSLWIGRSGKQISVELKEGTDLAAVAVTNPELVRVKYEPNLEAIKGAYAHMESVLKSEHEAALLTAGEAGEITAEVESQINHQIMERRKELLKQANLPDCFIVRHQDGTEYLVIK